MKYAQEISGMINAFNDSELTGKDLDTFYYDGTMFARTGVPGRSPINELYAACKLPAEKSAYLLLGHRGCGKSTELNKMSERLRNEGYLITTIQCNDNLDINNPLYTDLMVLMCDALLKMAKECGCELSEDIRKTIASFWKDATRVEKSGRDEESSVGAELSVNAPKLPVPILGDLLQLGVGVKSSIKYHEASVEEYRSRITRRIGDWIRTMNKIADSIADKKDGKRPIIIFEDLDKLDQKNAEMVFFERTSCLTGYGFPIIYTFPIALSYTARYNTLTPQFKKAYRFPMIKIETEEGDVFEEGFKTIYDLVKKRVKTELFDGDAFFFNKEMCGESVLYRMVEKTGGSLRNLFEVIRESSTLAMTRRAETIGMQDADIALTELQSELIIRIEDQNYPFLARICKGKKRQIEDKAMLLEMMQAGVVLEYNGRQWHNVHPLVRDFLEEENLLGEGNLPG